MFIAAINHAIQDRLALSFENQGGRGAASGQGLVPHVSFWARKNFAVWLCFTCWRSLCQSLALSWVGSKKKEGGAAPAWAANPGMTHIDSARLGTPPPSAAAPLSVATSDGLPQTHMKPYSILIHGSGPCGEGTEQSADIALTGLLQQLQTAGHKFESVSMVIDGSAVPIIGALKDHPGLDAAADPGAVSLASISKQIASLDGKLTRFVSYEKKDDLLKSGDGELKPRVTRAPRAKKEGAAPESGPGEGSASDQSQEGVADAGDGAGASDSTQSANVTGDAATTTEAPKTEGGAA